MVWMPVWRMLAFAFVLVSFAAWAQAPKTPLPKQPSKSGAEQPADGEPRIDISVFPAEKHRSISGGFDIYVTVTNTSKGTIRLLDLDVCLPRAMAEVVGPAIGETAGPPPGSEAPPEDDQVKKKPDAGDLECWRPGQRAALPKPPKEFDIPPGRQAYFNLSVPKVKNPFTWDQILFRRDSYNMQVYHVFRTDKDQPEERRIIREERALEFRPSLVAPLSGVVVGVILVALFMGLRKPEARFRVVKTWLPTIGGVTGSGLIAGMILVIVLNQTDAQQLPVTVSINDFWGGAFLGLLSYKLADWIDKKFLAKTA